MDFEVVSAPLPNIDKIDPDKAQVAAEVTVTGTAFKDTADNNVIFYQGPFPNFLNDVKVTGITSADKKTFKFKIPQLALGKYKMEVFFGSIIPSARSNAVDFEVIAAPSKKVFISSAKYNGNLGGLAGADQKCQKLADAVDQLKGKTFRAWLSSSTVAASVRIIHSNIPYKLMDGTTIADNWDDLTDGKLQNAINKNENGAQVPKENVWTNTNPDGTITNLNDDKTCKDWTSSLIGSLFGNLYVDSTWTSNGPCSSLYHLYCFEQ